MNRIWTLRRVKKVQKRLSVLSTTQLTLFSSIWMMFYLGCETPKAPVVSDPPSLSDSIQTELSSRSCEELSNEGFFERQILPLVTEGQEPSCSRCHLPGVDFYPFVQEDECQTLALEHLHSIVR